MNLFKEEMAVKWMDIKGIERMIIFLLSGWG